MSKLSIFLSHLTVESKLAEIFKAHLTRDFIGLIDIFVSSDRISIPAGSKWLSEVMDALCKASAHIILCSSESVKRPWINFEAGAAQLKNIPIIPVCHSGLTPAQIPVPLSASEGVDASHGDGIRKLYAAISRMLGSDVPEVDFDSYAKEVEAFEFQYKNDRPKLTETSLDQQMPEIIENPRVLCITSEQFRKLGFENQLQKVLKAFPSEIEHVIITNSKELQEQLRQNRFDMVHIAAFVCPKTGDLYFSDVNLQTGGSTSPEPDTIPPDFLANLLEMAKTQLVVITSCESLVLATTLISVTNVVATNDMVSPDMMAAWVENFYGVLSRTPLSQAFNFALTASRAPMKFYARQTKLSDIVFTVDENLQAV